MKKIIVVDKRAKKEIQRFVRPVQLKFKALFEVLEESGKLEEPFGKKLAGHKNLFEVRVKYKGEWRAIYAYIEKETVIILSAFNKKTQKTPAIELEKAINRLLNYEK